MPKQSWLLIEKKQLKKKRLHKPIIFVIGNYKNRLQLVTVIMIAYSSNNYLWSKSVCQVFLYSRVRSWKLFQELVIYFSFLNAFHRYYSFWFFLFFLFLLLLFFFFFRTCRCVHIMWDQETSSSLWANIYSSSLQTASRRKTLRLFYWFFSLLFFSFLFFSFLFFSVKFNLIRFSLANFSLSDLLLVKLSYSFYSKFLHIKFTE